MRCVIFNSKVFSDVARWIETWYGDHDDVVVLGYSDPNCTCTIDQVRADNPGKRVIVYQLEQLFDGSVYINSRTAPWLKKADEIWDFDLGNIAYLERWGFRPKYVPLAYTDRMQIPMKRPENRDIDVLFVGAPSVYRIGLLRDMLKKYQFRYSTVIGSGIYGLLLDELISRTKIFVNIHASKEYHCQEQVRLFRAVSGGCCVVTEKSPFNEFGKAVIECDYSQIGPVCTRLLQTGDWQKISSSAAETYRLHCQNRKPYVSSR